MERTANPHLFPIFQEPSSRWERSGLSPGQERKFNLAMTFLLIVFSIGWAYVIIDSALTGDSPGLAARVTTNPLEPNAPPEAAFVLDAVLRSMVDTEEFRGESGAVNVVIQDPSDTLALADSLPAGVELDYQPAERAGGEIADVPARPGIWNVVLRMRNAVRTVPDLQLITLVPATEARSGRIGNYRIGSWPTDVSSVPTPETYAPPRGFIRVTPENRDLRVSEHFLLGEFLTKGQTDVWPKYVVLSPRMLDKAELTIQELEEMGHPVERVGVISGFRTPRYNESGGNTQGRGDLSRHMYGDAVDFFVDNDGDFRMDDLNGDGRVTVADARVMAEAAERVEREHPNLVGGIGVYDPTGAHAGFIHIDTRGYRARW
ncbi:MAG TPA: hypothetical protein VFI91_08985 [Longimicrobiaceae bacterium]|nr:hypothetical protein [Longimicrobiaceae bacterium]